MCQGWIRIHSRARAGTQHIPYDQLEITGVYPGVMDAPVQELILAMEFRLLPMPAEVAFEEL